MRDSGKFGTKLCDWYACTRRVPESIVLCRQHWNKIPAELRHSILQMEDLDTQHNAIKYWLFKNGD